jgi:hypothetical protein
MLTGKQFKLSDDTLGLTELPTGKRKAVMVPANSVVRVLSGPLSRDDRMVDVLYKNERITMFAVDVRDRGEEVSDTNA